MYADTHEQETFGPRQPRIAIVLNGPPGVGKDTLADDFLCANPEFEQYAFKQALYRATADFFYVTVEDFKLVATDREKKEQPYLYSDHLLRWVTPREMLIHVSEEVIKPNAGKDYFGREAIHAIRESGHSWVFTDCGFSEEMPPLYEYFDHVAVVQLHRAGCNFDGDSRDWVTHPDEAYNFQIDLIDGEIIEGLLALERVLETLLAYVAAA